MFVSMKIEQPEAHELTSAAARRGIAWRPTDADDQLAAVTRALAVVNGLPAPAAAVPAALRRSARPEPSEDPFNALITKCDVEGSRTGSLLGLRVVVKDTVAVAGIPMTNGWADTEPVLPSQDALCVARLLAAGASIVGKANLDPSDFGPTLNPIDRRFSAGGSSSGSAAAVAGGLADAAIGHDVGGSIRLPASWCGVVGMKPTQGLVPLHGVLAWDGQLDAVGPITSTVAANAAMLEVMSGPDWRAPSPQPVPVTAGQYTSAASESVRGMRVGVVTEALDSAAYTHDTVVAFERALSGLRSLGAIVTPASVPLWGHSPAIWLSTLAFGLTVTWELGTNFSHPLWRDEVVAAWLQRRIQSTGPRPPGFPFGAAALPLVYECLRSAGDARPFVVAGNLRLTLAHQIDEALRYVDLLVTPTFPTGPTPVEETESISERKREQRPLDVETFSAAVFTTCPANLSGHPALTVPSGPGDHGLPTGLQLLGRRFEERTLYQLAFWYEALVRGQREIG